MNIYETTYCRLPAPGISSANRFILIMLIGLIYLMSEGCQSLKAPARTASDLSFPDSYAMASVLSREETRWWEDFSDPGLNRLIQQALDNNLTLQVYRARLSKARAQAAKAGAQRYPSLTGELQVGAGRRHNGVTDRTTGTESYAVGMVASYELDLWGRLAAQRQSASLAVAASEEDLKTAAMSIAAEIANRCFGMIIQQEQRKLLDTQLEINQTYLSLVELRFRQSQASALDVLQQQQLVESARAQQPLIDLQEQLLSQELAVLLGQWPKEIIKTTAESLPAFNALPEPGLPSQLLENRPDLRSAYFRLTGADQDLLAARADLLPSLSLTARTGFESDRISSLFDDWLANLLASLTAPLLDGGRRKAEVAFTEAAIREEAANYRQLALNAFREVEEALAREARLTEHLISLENQLQIGRRALEEARTRYLNGLTDYLPVLTQLLSVQALEKEHLARRGDILFA